ncbi:hypothetical protein UCDDS831_g09323 [Diplodia seriata]|uniref:Uncharacterized protein n=1 Tax=Diplodia seriata TaxID=420778 RepID=A0A0G2G7B9_9PEZI|nr:hypothetical protein UCDDS831_g09323 [Diplodia seriata]
MSGGFQTLADRMRARGLTRPTSASSDTNPLTSPNTNRTSQASQASQSSQQSSTSHSSSQASQRHHSSRITSTHTRTSSTDVSTRTAFTATPRIPSTDPARQIAHSQLTLEQRRVRELEATVANQDRTIRALNDRVDAQGRENANSAIAARALYGELEAQASEARTLESAR